MDPVPADTAADRLIVVDGANVVGSVPDGWWRDRRGAATRLRDALAARDAATLPAVLLGAVTLVVEGAARGVPPVAGVHVEAAPQSGDDHIVALVADNVGHRPVVVVTSDRELRQRVRELGASIVSPGELRASIPYGGRREST
jgi:predicted RNA-binding protein with PIN domain